MDILEEGVKGRGSGRGMWALSRKLSVRVMRLIRKTVNVIHSFVYPFPNGCALCWPLDNRLASMKLMALRLYWPEDNKLGLVNLLYKVSQRRQLIIIITKDPRKYISIVRTPKKS